MRIGVVAPPFIAVPPPRYGGTELFIANLAGGLHRRGHHVTVYATGDSCVECTLKWRYPRSCWPVSDNVAAQMRSADHAGWALHDAAQSADIIHLNDIVGLPMTQFIDVPIVATLHHPHEPVLTEQYSRYTDIEYVCISAVQSRLEPMPKMTVIHHGIPIERYLFRAEKDDYVAFLGRMAPCKGAHLAIEAAKRAGVRLKIAGEIQPVFQEYWEREVRPHVDGDRVQYIGEADSARKNDLLSRARALLFPIQWQEPFGLVMIESMACGTPVLALPGGSVEEIVENGSNGWICADIDEMAARVVSPEVAPSSCRESVAAKYTAVRMVEDYERLYERIATTGKQTTVEVEV